MPHWGIAASTNTAMQAMLAIAMAIAIVCHHGDEQVDAQDQAQDDERDEQHECHDLLLVRRAGEGS